MGFSMARPICSPLSSNLPTSGQGGRRLPLPPSSALAAPLSSPSQAASSAWARLPSINAAAPYAIWFLRLALGAVFLAHVRLNLFEYVPANITQMFGLPPGASGFAIAWEVLVAIALIIGVWPRAAALAGTATLFSGAVGAHAATTQTISQYGWQHPALWIAALIVLALSGDGAFALVPTALRIRKETLASLDFAPPLVGGFATGVAIAVLLWHLV